ncbi:MAG: NADH-quinone oxidoreductase subunit NuoH [Anaerolineaceae bacterium]
MDFWSDPYLFLVNWLHGLLVGWGLPDATASFILMFAGAFVLAMGAMLFVLGLIWFERKLIGRFQDRFGPNRVGPWGIIQPLADMLKIFTKEHITPAGVDPLPYNLGPVLAVAAVLAIWAVLPFTLSLVGADLDVSLLYVVAIGGLGEIAVVLSGWGSNNKYALLAAFRSIAQLLSYEVPLVIALLVPVMLSGSLSLNRIVHEQGVWYIALAPVAAFIFFIASIAEVGRSPFDLTEAESELVAGFNIEYSGLKFGMFYVADFLHAFTISLLFAVLFLGGWRGPYAEQYPLLGLLYFMLKAGVVYFINIWMRASFPRFRIDQMMAISWKLLTPLAIGAVILTAVIDKLLQYGQLLPNGDIVRVMVMVGANLFLVLIAGAVINLQRRKQSLQEFPLAPGKGFAVRDVSIHRGAK